MPRLHNSIASNCYKTVVLTVRDSITSITHHHIIIASNYYYNHRHKTTCTLIGATYDLFQGSLYSLVVGANKSRKLSRQPGYYSSSARHRCTTKAVRQTSNKLWCVVQYQARQMTPRSGTRQQVSLHLSLECSSCDQNPRLVVQLVLIQLVLLHCAERAT